MRCCVPTCTNSEKVKKSVGYKITFHLFPKQPEQREAWVKALGMKEWSPTVRTVVCSDHFRKDDLLSTKCGSRRVKSGAVPFVLQQELDAPAVMRMCKICLTLDTKMYNLEENYQLSMNKEASKLSQMYEDITGVSAGTNNSRLPQYVCWQCAARLANAAAFRAKALLSDGLLQDFLQKNSHIKIRDVISINRNHASLKSSLTSQKLDNEQTYTHNRVKDETIDIPEIELDFKEAFIKNEEVIVEHQPMTIKTEVDLVLTELPSDDFDGSIQFNDENNDSVDENIDDIDNDDDNNDVLKENPSVLEIEVSPGTEEFASVDEGERIDVNKEEEEKVLGTSRIRTKKKYVKPRQPIDENLLTVTPLSFERQIEEIERRQESARYKLSAYKCDVCFTGFPSEDKYARHAVKHSEQSGKYQCIICKIRTKKTWAMRTHMSRQHSEEFSCKQCPLVTRSRTVALEHMKFHAGKKYECPQCFNVYEKKTTLLNHLRLNHLSGFVCSLCGYTFVSMNGVVAHKRMKHPLIDKHVKLEGPYCKVCDVKFLCKKAYDKHLRLSSKHIESEDDPNRLSNDPTIKRRLGVARKKAERRPDIRPRDPYSKTLKPSDPVDCEQCGAHLQNLHEYSAHFKALHPGIHRSKYAYIKNPYMCEQCGKMFQNTTTLENHKWVHTGEKRFQCDHCHKTFSVKANLAGHMRLHEATRRSFPCRVCGKAFAFSFNRTRHMFLHTGLKPFKCDACEKCFVTSGELRAHVDYVHLKKPRPKRVRRKPRKCDVIEY